MPEHHHFGTMPVRWHTYVCTLRDFENCHSDSALWSLDDISNECFTTTLSQTQASEFEESFIKQLLVYYRDQIVRLAGEVALAGYSEHAYMLGSRMALYKGQAGILKRELLHRRQAKIA
jgi:hypothetical protein